jgi:hypothetical protein
MFIKYQLDKPIKKILMDFFYSCYTNILKQKIISRTMKRKVNKDNPRKSACQLRSNDKQLLDAI